MTINEQIAKATWDNYKSDFFKYLERKAKEGAKRYSLIGKLRDTWMRVDWAYAAKGYQSYIQEFHSQFHVFGMGDKKLDEHSTNVFLLDTPEFKRYDSSEQAEKINGLKLVFQDKRGEKLFIWGEPGAGKTTFLKQIVNYAVEKTSFVPMFVNIAEWAMLGTISQDGLLQYFAEQFTRCGFEDSTTFVEYLIEEGNAILLFDGLDEISKEKRNTLIALLEQNKKSKSRIIVSCRVDAIQSHLSGYWDVQVAKWDERRISDFIEKSFPNKQLRQKFIEELSVEDNLSLQDFRKNPLLLSLLCSFYKPEKGFPANRGEIYYEAIYHLLLERDQGKRVSRDPILDDLSLSHKLSLYSHLAYESFCKGLLYFTQQELEYQIFRILGNILDKDDSKNLDSSLILPKLISQHGILSRRSYRSYAFSHLTFQEYFTAKYIVDKGLFGELAKHQNDRRWREVFLLTANQV